MQAFKYSDHIRLLPAWKGGGKRYQAIDSLRGLAALGVVFFHFLVHYDKTYGYASWDVAQWTAYPALESLRYGPHFFFMISGFVILMTIDRTRSASTFIKKRLIRIVPAFWVALTLASLVTYFWGPDVMTVRLMDVLINGLFLQGLVDRPHIDAAYWSLLVEMAFYLMIAGIVYGAHLRSKMHWVLWAWLAITIAYIALWSNLAPPMKLILEEVFIVEYSVYFMAGMALYLAHMKGKMAVNLKVLLLFAVPLILAGLPQPYGFYVAPTILLLWLAVKGRLDWLLVHRPLLWLGALSYPLYVIHLNIGIALIHNLTDMGVADHWSVVAALVLSLALAQAIYSFIECPGHAWLKRRYL